MDWDNSDEARKYPEFQENPVLLLAAGLLEKLNRNICQSGIIDAFEPIPIFCVFH